MTRKDWKLFQATGIPLKHMKQSNKIIEEDFIMIS